MITWRKYGPIWISSGLFISAAGLWLYRANPSVIRGQDYAECLAAIVEKHVAELTFDEQPDDYMTLTTNTVTYTNYTAEVTLTFDGTTAGRVSCASGALLTFATTNWSTPQSVVMAVAASGTPVGDTLSYWRFEYDGTYEGRLAVLQVGGGGAVIPFGDPVACTNITFGPSGYQVPAGSNCTFSVVLNAAPTNNMSTYTVDVITTNIAANARVDDFIRWRVIYDYTLAAGRTMALDEGPLFWCQDSAAAYTNGLALVTVPRVWTNTATTGYAIGGDGVEEVSNRLWYQTSPSIGGPLSNIVQHVGTMSTWFPTYSGSIQTNYPLTNAPVADYLFTGTNYLVDAGSNWWQNAGLGGTAYMFRCESLSTNGVMIYDKRISTNLLTTAKTLANRMTTTMYVCDLSDCVATTCVSYVGEYNYSTNRTGTTGGPPGFDKYGMLPGAVDWTVTTNTPAVGNVLVDFDIQLQESAYDESGLFDDWTYSADVTADYTSQKLLGCKPPCPSTYACASGYVSQVKIFGVFSALPFGASAYIVIPTLGGTDPEAADITLVGGTVQTNGLELGLYTVGSTPSGLPVVDYTRDYVDTVDFADGAECSQYVLALIGTYDNPSTPPLFDLGTEAPAITASDSFNSGEWRGNRTVETLTQTDTAWGANHNSRVVCHKIIILVDWKWKHLNDATPFEPEDFIPEWANTNLP